MKLAFGSDHAGFQLRTSLEAVANEWGHEVVSYGAMSEDSFDYPLAADPVCESVLAGESDLGILICGSGVGVCIRANRFPGIRCANCWSATVAELARMHNHANVLALGQRLIDPSLAPDILKTFLETEPDTAERHERRVQQLDAGCK